MHPSRISRVSQQVINTLLAISGEAFFKDLAARALRVEIVSRFNLAALDAIVDGMLDDETRERAKYQLGVPNFAASEGVIPRRDPKRGWNLRSS